MAGHREWPLGSLAACWHYGSHPPTPESPGQCPSERRARQTPRQGVRGWRDLEVDPGLNLGLRVGSARRCQEPALDQTRACVSVALVPGVLCPPPAVAGFCSAGEGGFRGQGGSSSALPGPSFCGLRAQMPWTGPRGNGQSSCSTTALPCGWSRSCDSVSSPVQSLPAQGCGSVGLGGRATAGERGRGRQRTVWGGASAHL